MVQQKMNNSANYSRLEEMRAEMVRRIASLVAEDGILQTAVPGLSLYRRSEPTVCASATYAASLIVFVQGEKSIQTGARSCLCTRTSYLLTSVDLPVVSQVTKATPQEPILALVMSLEMPLVREILSQEEFHKTEVPCVARGMAVGENTVALLGASSRLLDLIDAPEEILFLSGLIQREIIYRLLRGPLGGNLRAIATLGEQSQRTARAVQWLRDNYTRPLRVEQLAEVARMGVSTLHHHFRALTAMSPLQYQKHLRLHTARQRMVVDGLDAASAAFEVGYESPSQFSREYSRFFGQSPVRDARAQRQAGASVAGE